MLLFQCEFSYKHCIFPLFGIGVAVRANSYTNWLKLRFFQMSGMELPLLQLRRGECILMKISSDKSLYNYFYHDFFVYLMKLHSRILICFFMGNTMSFRVLTMSLMGMDMSFKMTSFFWGVSLMLMVIQTYRRFI